MKANKKSEEALVETLVNVSRVTKVVKGGRKLSFSACVVVGDRNGMVGYGHGKAKEVAEARLKAAQAAKKNLLFVPLYQNRTIHHDIMAKSGAAKVLLRRANAGTGIIAGGSMRVIFDLVGINDIVAKSLGSSNTYSMISATFEALKSLSTPRVVAEKRNKKVYDISTHISKDELAGPKKIDQHEIEDTEVDSL